jgi:hypothetical protein
MSELEIIENKFTLPLDLARPRLDVRKGWNETIARKLGDMTRMLEHPRPTRNEAAKQQEEWYRNNQRTVYTLGRRASLLAMASFHEEEIALEGTLPKLEFRSYQEDTGSDFLVAFLQAVHYDLNRVKTWLEVDKDDAVPTRLYDAVGYRQPAPGDERIMIRE